MKTKIRAEVRLNSQEASTVAYLFRKLMKNGPGSVTPLTEDEKTVVVVFLKKTDELAERLGRQ